MGRIGWSALALVLLLAAPAPAQESATYNVGVRETGAVHPLTLTARNENCFQRLDFRFEFAPSPWLRPAQDSVVRGVPAGESRPLPALIDLTQTPPGRHVAEVSVTCENCEFLMFRTCQFNRQHITIVVDAVAPATAPITSAPAPETTAQRAPTASAPNHRPSTPADVEQPAPVNQELIPAPSMAAPVETPPPTPCNCANVDLLQALAIAAAAAAILLGAAAAFGFNAARKAQAQLRDTQLKSPADWRQFLQDQIENYQHLAALSREALVRLLQAQLQAMRALSAMGASDPRSPGVVSGAAAWSAICRSAGYSIDRSNHIVRDNDVVMLQEALEAAFDSLRNSGFPSFSDGGGGHAERLAWLQHHGFAADDIAAQAALNEIASYFASGHAMTDMNARLKEQADECRRCDLELAAHIAQSGG